MFNLHETSPYQVYLNHLKKGELAYQFSIEDGKAVFYPRAVAPVSGNTNMEWRVSKGLGTVYSTTTMFPRNGEPYDISLIDMDEGFRLMSRVEGLGPQDVGIGLRVKVKVHPGDESAGQDPYPVFEPAE